MSVQHRIRLPDSPGPVRKLRAVEAGTTPVRRLPLSWRRRRPKLTVLNGSKH